MEYYEYKTKSRTGRKVVRGIITADDRESAANALKRRGEVVLELGVMQDFMNIRRTVYNLSSRIGRAARLDFFVMLKFMLESGLSLYESLTSIRDTSTNKALRSFSRTVGDEVRKGAPLSAALKKCGQIETAIYEQIKAGEESGRMNETLSRVIAQLERDKEFRGKVKSAMMYPVIICVVMAVVLWVMMTMVVPKLAATLVSMGGELPLVTKIVIGTSNLMKKATPFLILAAAAAVVLYRIMVKNPDIRIKVDSVILKIPIVGEMIEKTELSRLCQNLSAMQESGITLVSSLNIVKQTVKNTYIMTALDKARRLIEVSGINLAVALSRVGSFPQMMIQMLEVGINTGKITDVLDKLSERYETEVDTGLKRITSLIEPILIVVVGLLAGTVVVAIFIPMWQITDNLGV